MYCVCGAARLTGGVIAAYTLGRNSLSVDEEDELL